MIHTKAIRVSVGLLLLAGCSGSGHDSGKKVSETATVVKGAVIECVAASSLPETFGPLEVGERRLPPRLHKGFTWAWLATSF